MNVPNVKSPELFELYYQAMFAKDACFEGVFFTAVKTTGIFCRPTCTARKPKKENVEFFASAHEAISNGFRACKVCRPLEKVGEMPDYVKHLLAELEGDSTIKLKDSDLMKRGIEPNTIRRWFQKNRGMTFHSYQRVLVLKNAFGKLREGESVTTAAFDAGYDSLSGFNHSFKSIFGISPSTVRQNQDISVR